MDSCLETLRMKLSGSVEGMSDQQMEVHAPGKWCVAEILEHLYLTYTGTVKGMEKVMAAGKPLVTPKTLWRRVQTLTVVGFGVLPEGRKAPAQSTPRGLPREQVRAEIGQKIELMDAMLTQCERKFGTGGLMDHPILGALTAAQWRKFHLVHGMHHMKQIRRLRDRHNA